MLFAATASARPPVSSPVLATRMENTYDKTDKIIRNILTLLRNGATIAGTDPQTAEYREKCLEQAYLFMSQDLVPELAGLGVLPKEGCDQRLSNLIDVSAMMQKKIITRRYPS